MHAVAVKKELIKKHPWLPEAIFKAYSESKKIAYGYLTTMAGLMDSLPWLGQEFDETRKLMGNNYYSYGLNSNRKILETLFRYSYEQGLCNRELTIEELFDPSGFSLNEE